MSLLKITENMRTYEEIMAAFRLQRERARQREMKRIALAEERARKENERKKKHEEHMLQLQKEKEEKERKEEEKIQYRKARETVEGRWYDKFSFNDHDLYQTVEELKAAEERGEGKLTEKYWSLIEEFRNRRNEDG